MTNIEKVLQAQQEIFLDTMKQMMHSREKPLSIEDILDIKRKNLGSIHGRIEGLAEQKKKGVQFLDDHMEVYRNEITRLEREIKVEEENFRRIIKESKQEDVRRNATDTDLTRVNGIGDKYKSLLMKKNITKVADIAKLKSNKLAKLLNTSENRASEIINNAKYVLKSS